MDMAMITSPTAPILTINTLKESLSQVTGLEPDHYKLSRL